MSNADMAQRIEIQTDVGLKDVLNLLLQMRVDRAGEVARTDTRLEHIEKQLNKIDSLSTANSELKATMQQVAQAVRQLENAHRDQEARLRLVEKSADDYAAHKRDTEPLRVRFQTLETRFNLIVGGGVVLQLLLLPIWSLFIAPLFER